MLLHLEGSGNLKGFISAQGMDIPMGIRASIEIIRK